MMTIINWCWIGTYYLTNDSCFLDLRIWSQLDCPNYLFRHGHRDFLKISDYKSHFFKNSVCVAKVFSMFASSRATKWPPGSNSSCLGSLASLNAANCPSIGQTVSFLPRTRRSGVGAMSGINGRGLWCAISSRLRVSTSIQKRYLPLNCDLICPSLPFSFPLFKEFITLWIFGKRQSKWIICDERDCPSRFSLHSRNAVWINHYQGDKLPSWNIL